MKFLSAERAAVREWLANYWPHRARAEAVALDYEASYQQNHLMWADLARFCNAGDTSLGLLSDGRIDPVQTVRNEARREVWLHMRAMLRLSEEDTEKLLMETEE